MRTGYSAGVTSDMHEKVCQPRTWKYESGGSSEDDEMSDYHREHRFGPNDSDVSDLEVGEEYLMPGNDKPLELDATENASPSASEDELDWSSDDVFEVSTRSFEFPYTSLKRVSYDVGAPYEHKPCSA